ncbi:hypothetical protein MASR1M31_03720 [Porphyromonadaceae bacterium]
MIINTTYVVEAAAAQHFIDYLREFYIPKATATGLLTFPRLSRILREGDPEEGISIALQFSSQSNDHYLEWHDERGQKLARMLTNKFGHSVVGFTTYMEEIEL